MDILINKEPVYMQEGQVLHSKPESLAVRSGATEHRTRTVHKEVGCMRNMLT